MSLILILLAFGRNSGTAQTQTEERERFMSWEEFVEDFLDEETEEESESRSKTDYLYRLEELYARPINLNTASRDELLQLPFINEAQADSLLAYRQRKRMLLSAGELMFIPNMDWNTRRRLSLFAIAGDTVAASVPLRRKLLSGRHEITSRTDIPLYRKAGNRPVSDEELAKHPNRTYLGNGIANTVRYRYRWRQEVAYGMTLQKDAGEPFGKGGNVPYDYTSFYLSYEPRGGRFAIWIGDYDVRMGQGLLLGNAFFAGRKQSVESLPRNRNEIKVHTSTDEANFMRGVAGRVSYGRWTFTGFASYRRLDGRLENGKVTSFKTDGLHRTFTELERRRIAGCTVAGGHAAWSEGGWTLGAGGYGALYSKEIAPSLKAYNRYYLRGKAAAGGTADWSLRKERWSMAGEAAMDREGHGALSTTLRYVPATTTALTLHVRGFSPHFVAPFAETLQENSHVQNEQAILLGGQFRLPRNVELLAYADFFRHTRPLFRAGAPSHGLEAFVMAKYIPENANRSFHVRYRIKTKQQDITGHAGWLEYVGTQRLQVAADFGASRFRMHTAADWALATRQAARNTMGGMLSARGSFAANGGLKLSLFSAVFFTGDYATRLFAYEPQLPQSSSFPTFAYHGLRLAMLAEWKASSRCRFGMRYGLTHYFNRRTIGSGTELIDSSSRNDLSVQLSVRL